MVEVKSRRLDGNATSEQLADLISGAVQAHSRSATQSEAQRNLSEFLRKLQKMGAISLYLG